MTIFYFCFFICCIPIFLLYLILSLSIPAIRIGKINKGKGEKVFIVKDIIHSDYIFESKYFQDVFPTKQNYVKIGWGDRKIFLETKKWSELKIKDFLFAFFGLNKTVLRVDFSNALPSSKQEIDISSMQLQILKNHILGSTNKKKIIKNTNYYEIGDYYESDLNYNCITNCNNWVNYGLFKAKITNRLWAPISFWV